MKTGTPTESPDGTKFNEAPLGWREVPEEQWANKFWRWAVTHEEYRQIMNRHAEESIFEVQLWWFEGVTGVGLAKKYDKLRQVIGNRYFIFGCEHDSKGDLSEMEGRVYRSGSCLTHTKCSKCGYIQTIDSSD